MTAPASSGGAWQGWWQRGAVHFVWASLGSGGDGKDYPGQGNAYGFAFVIQPRSQPLSMFGAGTVAAGRVVADHVAGFAVPRLIERDNAGFSGPRFGLTPHQSIPLAGTITTTLKIESNKISMWIKMRQPEMWWRWKSTAPMNELTGWAKSRATCCHDDAVFYLQRSLHAIGGVVHRVVVVLRDLGHAARLRLPSCTPYFLHSILQQIW